MDNSIDNQISPDVATRRPGWLVGTWRGFLKAPWSAKFGFLVIFSYVFVALFAPLLTPYGESCLLYTSPSPRDATLSRMPSSA